MYWLNHPSILSIHPFIHHFFFCPYVSSIHPLTCLIHYYVFTTSSSPPNCLSPLSSVSFFFVFHITHHSSSPLSHLLGVIRWWCHHYLVSCQQHGSRCRAGSVGNSSPLWWRLKTRMKRGERTQSKGEERTRSTVLNLVKFTVEHRKTHFASKLI